MPGMAALIYFSQNNLLHDLGKGLSKITTMFALTQVNITTGAKLKSWSTFVLTLRKVINKIYSFIYLLRVTSWQTTTNNPTAFSPGFYGCLLYLGWSPAQPSSREPHIKEPTGTTSPGNSSQLANSHQVKWRHLPRVFRCLNDLPVLSLLSGMINPSVRADSDRERKLLPQHPVTRSPHNWLRLAKMATVLQISWRHHYSGCPEICFTKLFQFCTLNFFEITWNR